MIRYNDVSSLICFYNGYVKGTKKMVVFDIYVVAIAQVKISAKQLMTELLVVYMTALRKVYSVSRFSFLEFSQYEC